MANPLIVYFSKTGHSKQLALLKHWSAVIFAS